MDPRTFKLVVGWPWVSPFVFSAFADSLSKLRHPRGWNVEFVRGTGWSPARRHMHICEQALDRDADLILIVGADQIYEPDLLERLVSRAEEGYEVVSALVPCRGYVGWQQMRPFQPMAWRFKKSNENQPIRPYRGMLPDRDMLELIEPAGGEMQTINFIGSGVLMFHRDHLLALKKPWFFERIDPETQIRLASMDTTFVWRLQSEAFAKVWCDTTIKVKHLHIFEIDETYQDRFSDWAEPGQGDPQICVGYPESTQS